MRSGVSDAHQRADPVINRHQRARLRDYGPSSLVASKSAYQSSRIDTRHCHHGLGFKRIIRKHLNERPEYFQRSLWRNSVEVQPGCAANKDVAFREITLLDQVILNR